MAAYVLPIALLARSVLLVLLVFRSPPSGGTLSIGLVSSASAVSLICNVVSYSWLEVPSLHVLAQRLSLYQSGPLSFRQWLLQSGLLPTALPVNFRHHTCLSTSNL